ncbi:MAG: Segregation and condensation protein B [Phycisphaerae bacterium]|nr:Segregation and condensation protein B [Phycisphaerae bacterium]
MNEQETPEVSASPAPLDALAQQIEALLLASDEPLSHSKLGVLTGAGRKEVRAAIEALNAAYETGGHSFRVEEIAEGLQMLTLGKFNDLLEQLLAVRRDSKLSQAALETLAVVAYKQPVQRADIEIIRGVACGEVLRSLMEKRLVKIVGRAEVLGRPMLYGTTRRFLEVFGLKGLADLPKAEQLKNPDRQAQESDDAAAKAAAETPAESPAESPAEPAAEAPPEQSGQ